MAYSTSTNITDRIPERIVIQLCDDEKLTADGDTLAEAIAKNSEIDTRIDAAIADADTMIDTYLRKRYDVPITDTAPTLTKCSVDLAIFNLHARRQSEFDPPQAVVTNQKAAIEVLKGINKAEIDIGIEPPPTASSAVVATADGEDRIFTEDNFENW